MRKVVATDGTSHLDRMMDARGEYTMIEGDLN